MIYAVEAVGLDRVKIGYAGSDASLANRCESYATSCPVETRLLGVRDGTMLDERALHAELAQHRVRGEWFVLSAIAATMNGFLPWSRSCDQCKGLLPVSAARRRKTGSCRACSRTQPRFGRTCLGCGTEISAKAAYHQRYRVSKGEQVRCKSCPPDVVACLRCKGTVVGYARKGLCQPCYMHERQHALKDARATDPCASCGTTESPRSRGQGLCVPCQWKRQLGGTAPTVQGSRHAAGWPDFRSSDRKIAELADGQ